MWEHTKLPMLRKESMTMEAVNTTMSKILGLIKNPQVSVSDFSYFLLCQVVENTGFKILLGHPITVIAQAITKDFHNGDQHVTIFEPVSS
ncbi:hypothetical protein L208DRAFT_1018626, partial [Tricholoma matsutake]